MAEDPVLGSRRHHTASDRNAPALRSLRATALGLVALLALAGEGRAGQYAKDDFIIAELERASKIESARSVSDRHGATGGYLNAEGGLAKGRGRRHPIRNAPEEHEPHAKWISTGTVSTLCPVKDILQTHESRHEKLVAVSWKDQPVTCCVYEPVRRLALISSSLQVFWQGSIREHVGEQRDIERGGMPYIFEFKFNYCGDSRSGGECESRFGNFREFDPGAIAGDKRGLGNVRLAAGLPESVLRVPSRDASRDGGNDARYASDHPVPALTALVAFIAGALGLIWTFLRGGPAWLICGSWVACVVGGVLALHAALLWTVAG